MIYLIFASMEASCANTIEGYTEEVFWYKFDMNLWTFQIYFNHGTSNENFQISSSKSECVKAVRSANSKIIEYLPVKVYETFPALIALSFHNCSIKGIRYENFENLSDLQSLHLVRNQIKFIPTNTFKDLTELIYLDLENNKLFYISDDDFRYLKNLQMLYLSNNQISFVSKIALSSMPELRNISLHDNTLKILGDDHFENNQKLEHIWLYNNEIKVLTPTFLKNIATLKLVNLNNNTCINSDFCDTFFSCDYKFSRMEDKIKEKC